MKPSRAAFADSLLLALVLGATCIPVVRGLGFYSDDWSYLANYQNAPRQDFLSLARNMQVFRPVAELYRIGLFKAFRLRPLGYHLVNSLVLLGVVLMMRAVLREIGFSRLTSTSVAALYAVLPHFSSIRYWYLSFQASLSILLYLSGTLLDVRSDRVEGSRRRWLRAFGIALLVASALAYELIIPLFLLNAAAAYWRGLRNAAGRRGFRTAFPWRYAAAALALAVFKLTTGAHHFEAALGIRQQMSLIWRAAVKPDYGPGDSGLNLISAIRVNLLDYGLFLPRTLWRIGVEKAGRAGIAAAGGIALLVGASITKIAREPNSQIEGREVRRIAGLGALVFVLGYSIFLTNRNIQVTPTGTGNRTAAVAAIGIAMIFIGVFEGLCTRARGRAAAAAIFGIAMGVVCGAESLILYRIASDWREAYRSERTILGEIGRKFPSLPAGASLLLDGVCRYVGPAPVFESSWDLQGALQLLERDLSLRGDIVNPTLKVRPDGIYTAEYDTESLYPYGSLLVFNATSGMVWKLGDEESAKRYFRSVTPDPGNGCPPGYGGWGVPIF